MLELLLLAQSEQFNNLAQIWLAQGASSFKVCHQSKVLAEWTSASSALAALANDEITSPLLINGINVGELRLGGLSGVAVKQRLNADAALIAMGLNLWGQLDSVRINLAARLKQQQLITELEVASDIQLRLLPQFIPSVVGLDIFASSLPALQVGGDFYDFVHENQRPFVFSVGDVAGKGVSAAILMAMARIVVHNAAKFIPRPTPAAVLSRVNQDLYQDFTEVGLFATVFVGQYHPEEERIYYINAGHSPVIYCPAGKSARLLQAEDTAMGILPSISYQDQWLNFKAGDLLLVGTDGFSEARNPAGDLYGYERLQSLAEQVAELSAAEICQFFFATIQEFGQGQPQDDDQTLLVIKGVS